MLKVGLLSSFWRLGVNERIGQTVVSRSITTNVPLCFQITQYLCAEPLKKKKRLDPAIIRARDERRKKKLEKQIRKLERNARQPKPIDECEIPISLVDPQDLKIRLRKPPQLAEEEEDARVCLTKSWTQYRHQRALTDLKVMDRIAYSQDRALKELRHESEELYQEAIQIDPGFLPFSAKGPVLTPPIKDYDSPDGEYIDVTKKWI